MSAFDPKRTLDLSPTRSRPARIGVCLCKILWKPIAAQRHSHGEKRQVKKGSVASAPCGPRTTSRGLRYLLASESKWSDVSDRGRRPGSEDRLVFPAA